MRLPQTLGRYEFLSLLGVGGGGAVYAGVEHGDLGLSHDVAIKVLDGKHDALGGTAAFADEARILSRIAHPCVVPIRNFAVLEHEVLGTLHIIVMPLVRGMKLSTLLRTCGEQGVALPLAATLHLLLQLADALEAVHTAADEAGEPIGLVHRDIKPANLRVSAQGDLRVLDFGIAWATQRSVAQTQGMIKGSLRYLSPEQLSDHTPDGRSDLYALGAVAFEMLVGEPFVMTEGAPITAALLGSLLSTRLVDRLPALRAQLQDVHGLTGGQAEHVTDLLVRLLQTDRERRFPHARAVGAALESVASGRPIRRGRRWLAGVVAGASLADTTSLHSTQRVRLAQPTAPAPVSTGPAGSWVVPALVLAVLAFALVAAVLSAKEPEADSLDFAPAQTVEQLEAAAAALPPLTIEHSPPLRGADSGDRVFRATVIGSPVDCVPRLQMRAGAGGRWVSRPMLGSGGNWELSIPSSEMDAFAGTAEYWIRCGRPGLTPRAQWRSAQQPERLEL